MGMGMELQHLTDAPTVKCSQCGARANQSHNVCFPVAHEQ
jgi:predicted nucleic acid-binding Zn ribbon protein